MVKCPACLPPDNKYCDTCLGANEVTEESAQAFLVKQQEESLILAFSMRLQEIFYEPVSVNEKISLLNELINEYKVTE